MYKILLLVALILCPFIFIKISYPPQSISCQQPISFPFEEDLQNLVDHPDAYTLEDALAMIQLLKAWSYKVISQHLNLDEPNFKYFERIMLYTNELMETTIPYYGDRDEL